MCNQRNASEKPCTGSGASEMERISLINLLGCRAKEEDCHSARPALKRSGAGKRIRARTKREEGS